MDTKEIETALYERPKVIHLGIVGDEDIWD